MRHLLEQYGEIGRVYLAAEGMSYYYTIRICISIYLSCIMYDTVDPLVRKKRKKMGGHQNKKYTEGWVEFESKKDAKMAAALLNGEPMGGKKRSSHYYDLWCIKYLPKFTWDNLTEELNYQRAVMDQKMAAEVAAAHRERDFYLSRVDKAKAVESIIERQQTSVHVKDKDESNSHKDSSKGPRKVRVFQQKRAKPESHETGGSVSSSLLKKLAGD
jgi:ESF2/ABP1 family protein